MSADWRDFEFDEMPEWSPKAQNVLLSLFVYALIAVGIFFLVLPINQDINIAKQEESMLRNQFRTKAEQVASLPDIDEQMVALRDFYLKLKAQLPEEGELATLLAGINDTGLAFQLDFKQLHWQKGEKIGWLLKLPLSIELDGTYQNIGEFSSALSRLPRIVALQDLSLTRIEDENRLKLSVIAHTYRFVDIKGDEA